jgi:hypothetical protein
LIERALNFLNPSVYTLPPWRPIPIPTWLRVQNTPTDEEIFTGEELRKEIARLNLPKTKYLDLQSSSPAPSIDTPLDDDSTNIFSTDRVERLARHNLRERYYNDINERDGQEQRENITMWRDEVDQAEPPRSPDGPPVDWKAVMTHVYFANHTEMTPEKKLTKKERREMMRRRMLAGSAGSEENWWERGNVGGGKNLLQRRRERLLKLRRQGK